MKTLDEIKEEVAIKQGWDSYQELTNALKSQITKLESIWEEISEQYKTQAVIAILDEAAINATASYKYVGDEWGMNSTIRAYVKTESILSLKPKTILK